jgi:hypothetical protein
MRYLNRLAIAAVVLGLSASSVFAQQGSVTSGLGGTSLGSLTGTGGLAGGGGGALGGGGGGAGGGQGGNSLGGTPLQTMQPAPVLGPPTGQNSSSLDASNIFAGYYANPYYQGQITAQTSQGPGGFGNPLYSGGSLGGTGSARLNTRGGTTGTAGRTAGLGGTGGLGGRTGGLGGVGANNYGVMVPLPVQITYAAVADFPTQPVATPVLQADLTGMIARSVGQLANPAGVQVFTTDNNTVILRGTVQNAREARLVEGMVRLTPGVGFIKNELTFPAR